MRWLDGITDSLVHLQLDLDFLPSFTTSDQHIAVFQMEVPGYFASGTQGSCDSKLNLDVHINHAD